MQSRFYDALDTKAAQATFIMAEVGSTPVKLHTLSLLFICISFLMGDHTPVENVSKSKAESNQK